MGRNAQYLVVIYALEHTDGAPVATGRIARLLNRSPAAATEMIQRLANDELVQYERYSGVELTDAGREQAAELYDTHKTLCRFFRDVLTLDNYAQEALSLAGAVDPDIARRLETTILPPDSDTMKPITLLPSREQLPPTKGKEQTDASQNQE
ncbi:metal-dependent transcriptional regulator [Halegenticoccus tardaugens]|uniref:metal-dependent transcriptional regulator n=1 Tax=Halegenticoccus tardaugens TaxID=2071624 RepID=UPI00100A611E|nr:metal-dependent transcriptional regulator [Halegenticoccus tardaugens]